MKNAGFLAVQELGEILGYAEKAGEELVEVRTGNNFQNELSRLIFACDVSLIAMIESISPKERSEQHQHDEVIQ